MGFKIKSSHVIPTTSYYLDYWDTVVEQWLRNMFSSDPLKEQSDFAKDLKIGEEFILNRLPEPYWGDPEHCSFVILNYNPGPCHDSRHNYRFCEDSKNCMINEIKKHKYSGFAKSFPLLGCLSSTNLWFEDSIGRKWWQQQSENWIEDFMRNYSLSSLPFAMELCAWHSDEWNGIKKTIFTKNKNLIERTIFNPLKDTIVKSKLGLGLCFGKRIDSDFLDKFSDKNAGPLHDITKYPGGNYKIYTFKDGKKDYYIINFWDDKNRRNRYPKNVKEIIDILSNEGITI